MAKVKINTASIEIILLAALGIVLLLNLFLSGSINTKIGEKISLVKELAKPANLQLTIITDKNCKDCFSIAQTADSIKKANVNILKEEELDISSAKALISKYGIKVIPTIIITGEINKTNFGDFEEKGNALVFAKQAPPYTDAVSGKILGKVSLIHLKDKSCDKCTDLTTIIDGLKQSAKIVDEKTLDISSSEGKELIKKYSIEQVPTLILSNELSVYTTISQGWSNVGTVEKDGSYVVREISPPYINASTNKIVGLVDLTMLTDKSCASCYDVTLHKPILVRFSVDVTSEKTVDIADNEGKELIKKYDIKLAPTIILSKDAGVYTALKQIWPQVGSIEDDGTYVFRDVKQMGSYKDLEKGEVIQASK